MKNFIVEEVEGLYRIIKLDDFRKTPGVTFDVFPMEAIPHISSIDRVIHHSSAVSPGPVGDVKRPWYMHTDQDDNLIVLHGTREVDVYTPAHGKIESFTVSPDKVYKNGKLIYEGGAMLVWPKGVFHRVRSDEQGSASINMATHYPAFDIKDNFNIYEVDVECGEYRVLREGFKDQKIS